MTRQRTAYGFTVGDAVEARVQKTWEAGEIARIDADWNLWVKFTATGKCARFTNPKHVRVPRLPSTPAEILAFMKGEEW